MYNRSNDQNNSADSIPVQSAYRIGFFAALLTALLSVVTFAFAFAATPISGFFYLENCAEYPYLATFGQYPKDFRWLMSASFLFMAFTFSTKDRLERFIRWTFMIAFGLTALALAYFALVFGMEREYGFEVAAISIEWLALLIGGQLLSALFRRRLRVSNN